MNINLSIRVLDRIQSRIWLRMKHFQRIWVIGYIQCVVQHNSWIPSKFPFIHSFQILFYPKFVFETQLLVREQIYGRRIRVGGVTSLLWKIKSRLTTEISVAIELASDADSCPLNCYLLVFLISFKWRSITFSTMIKGFIECLSLSVSLKCRCLRRLGLCFGVIIFLMKNILKLLVVQKWIDTFNVFHFTRMIL
jgi:hypothetical protein